jgi:predicted GIY-YIG superfamily endonuclease
MPPTAELTLAALTASGGKTTLRRSGRKPCLACDAALTALGCDAALTLLADQIADPFPLCRRCRRGVVYLLHFTQPYRHARHYIGFTTDLAARLAALEVGRGARLMQVIGDAGIEWRLARLWPGDRRRERAIKRQGGAARSCPLCGVHPRTAAQVKGSGS